MTWADVAVGAFLAAASICIVAIACALWALGQEIRAERRSRQARKRQRRRTT